MYVEHLEIRKPSYGDSDAERTQAFVATVTLKGVMGETKVKLSTAAMSKIFSVISQEVCSTAQSNARAVTSGMSEAVHAPLAMESAKIEVLE